MPWVSTVTTPGSPGAFGSTSSTVSVPGGSPARRGVHEDHARVAAVQGVGQVHAADAEVHDVHPGGQRPLGEQPRHLDAEAVVAEEDVADPGDQDPGPSAVARRAAPPRPAE